MLGYGLCFSTLIKSIRLGGFW